MNKNLLLERIKKDIDRAEIISFDIFDTLLLRPYVKPTDLFTHLERLENINGFAKARINAENLARKHHKDKEEITLDEIYIELPEKYKHLKNKELSLEHQILQPNIEIKQIFDYAKSQGKRIIIISDMYLAKRHLSNILIDKGYEGFEKLYVSSDIKKTKWTGNLYKYVCADLKITASKILHIGDNKQSDVIIARKMGLCAFHYTAPIKQLLENDLRAYKFYEINNNHLGTSILLGCLSMYNVNKKENYWQDFGFRYGGPVVYGYMQWLVHQLKKDNINEALFVARDGYSLQKVFDIIKNENIKTYYYYAPRIINLVCNLNYEKNKDVNENQGFIAVKAILSYFKNKDAFLEKNTPEIKNYAEGDNFIKKHYKVYEKLSVQEKLNYQKYFSAFNITSKKIALIDTCSMMFSAQKSLAIGLPDKEISGYYWVIWNKSKEETSKYILSSFQKNSQHKFIDWSIMELYMTAPTPPADRIENGKVIFKDINEQEQKRIDIYPDLSNGIVEYAKFVNKIFQKCDLFLDATTLVNWTNILCKIPTEIDKKEFKDIQHARDAEHKQYKPIPSSWFINEKDLKIKVLGLTLFKVSNKLDKIKVSLFGYIPFIKITNKNGKQRWKILGVPFLYVKKKTGKICAKLFGFIPLLQINREKF